MINILSTVFFQALKILRKITTVLEVYEAAVTLQGVNIIENILA
jgi:hypothetical protein